MANYRRELPGDVLSDLLRQQRIESVAEFTRQHEVRIGRALEERLEEEERLDAITPEEEEALFDRLTLTYPQWTNRFRVIWDPRKEPKEAWRAIVAEQDIDALILAGWFQQDSEMHIRLKNSVKLQNALWMDSFSYGEIEDIFRFDEKVDLGQAYNAVCFGVEAFMRAHPETRAWSFPKMAAFVSGLAKESLRAIADIGLLDLPEDWIEGLPGLEETRGVPSEEVEKKPVLTARIADWVMLMLEDRLEGMRG
jgi:hypothetical protein